MGLALFSPPSQQGLVLLGWPLALPLALKVWKSLTVETIGTMGYRFPMGDGFYYFHGVRCGGW